MTRLALWRVSKEISLALPGQYRGALKLSLAELLHEEMKSPNKPGGLITQALDELTDESLKLKAHALLSNSMETPSTF